MENEQERRKWRIVTRVLILFFLAVIVLGVLSLLLPGKAPPALLMPFVG